MLSLTTICIRAILILAVKVIGYYVVSGISWQAEKHWFHITLKVDGKSLKDLEHNTLYVKLRIKNKNFMSSLVYC